MYKSAIFALLLLVSPTVLASANLASPRRSKLFDLFNLEKVADESVQTVSEDELRIENVPQKVFYTYDELTFEQKNNSWSLFNQALAQNITDSNQLIYIIATALGNTKLVPTREERAPVGTQARRIQDEYWYTGFYGRGYVPEVFHGNSTYANFSWQINVDMTQYPDRALTPNISAAILISGMKFGNFTGRKLRDYFNATKIDFEGARNIIQVNDTRKRDYANIAKAIFDGQAKDQGGFALKDSETLHYLEPLMTSLYFNADRKAFPSFFYTTTGYNYTILNSKDDYPYFFTQSILPEISNCIYQNPTNLINTSSFFEYLNNDPQLGPVDKSVYLDVVRKARWYGPYKKANTEEYYMASLLDTGANEYYVEIKFGFLKTKYDEFFLNNYKLSFKKGNYEIAPALECKAN